MGIAMESWAPGRAIRLYCTGINREAGIHFYPWRKHSVPFCLNQNFQNS